jgi:hypothetical protein
LISKRNIIKNTKCSQVHREYTRGASKTEKEKRTRKSRKVITKGARNAAVQVYKE